MESSKFIKRIKNYSIISVLLPLITINSCFLLYKFLGSVKTYPNIDWNQKKIEVPIKQWISLTKNTKLYTLTNCPKYKTTRTYIAKDNKIVDANEIPEVNLGNLDNEYKTAVLEQSDIINKECIKNHNFIYPIINNFNSLEKIVINAITINNVGFVKIRNPYLYGEASISRTARYFPATYIFKPLIILSAIFLLLYWKNNLNLFNELRKKNILENFPKSFFYLGVLSCIFLILHASFLGLEYDSKLFSKIRRLIIILFIIFELLAQISLTICLFKLKENLNIYIRRLVLNTKIIFVSLVLVATLISFIILGFFEPSTSFKHMLEWNYFSLLLVYYVLSRLLWKS
tara:strand:- start:5337 stop:6368 length:1032 start_codon:yes stop_codon:yes gene_type:complete